MWPNVVVLPTKKGKTSRKSRKCTVAKYAKKKVPAGTFDAYQVRCSIKTIGRKGRSHTSTWYDANSLTITGKVIDRYLEAV